MSFSCLRYTQACGISFQVHLGLRDWVRVPIYGNIEICLGWGRKRGWKSENPHINSALFCRSSGTLYRVFQVNEPIIERFHCQMGQCIIKMKIVPWSLWMTIYDKPKKPAKQSFSNVKSSFKRERLFSPFWKSSLAQRFCHCFQKSNSLMFLNVLMLYIRIVSF